MNFFETMIALLQTLAFMGMVIVFIRLSLAADKIQPYKKLKISPYSYSYKGKYEQKNTRQ